MPENEILIKSCQLKSERLLMHPYDTNDLGAVLSLLKNEEIKKTFMIPDYSSEEEYIDMFYRLKDMSHSDDYFEYGVYLNNQLIGFINDTDIDGQMIEIGYVIHPDMKGQGYATEVLSTAIKELFRMGYSVIRACYFEGNIGSRRVMEKCGMKMIDKTENIEYQGKLQRCIYFEIVKYG